MRQSPLNGLSIGRVNFSNISIYGMERSKAVLTVGSYDIVREVTENAMLEWLAKEGTSDVLIISWRVTLNALALGPYMDANNLRDMRTLYRSFCRVGGLKVLCAAFKAHVLVRKSLTYLSYK